MIAQGNSFLFEYADVMMATVALGLFVGVGVVSMKRVRPKLKYETWYYLHLYTYLALALSFAHALANGAQFIDSPLNRLYWYGLYAVMVGMVLWFRVLVPIRANARHHMRIAQVVVEGPGVVSVVISGRHLAELGAESGHFFRWRFMSRDGWWQSHPYSLSAPPQEGWLRITVKDLGDHSSVLSKLRPGTRVLAEGPYGVMTQARRRRRKVLLVAGGVGVTPLRALFESLPGAPGDVALVYRASTAQDVVLRGELDQISYQRGSFVHYCIGPRGGLGDPFVAGRLAAMFPDLKERDVYLCGPTGMTDVAVRAVRKAGVPARHIHVERFEL